MLTVASVARNVKPRSFVVLFNGRPTAPASFGRGLVEPDAPAPVRSNRSMVEVIRETLHGTDLEAQAEALRNAAGLDCVLSAPANRDAVLRSYAAGMRAGERHLEPRRINLSGHAPAVQESFWKGYLAGHFAEEQAREALVNEWAEESYWASLTNADPNPEWEC